MLLCWHVGEDEIGFWHGLDEGFAGSKPLPLDYDRWLDAVIWHRLWNGS